MKTTIRQKPLTAAILILSLMFCHFAATARTQEIKVFTSTDGRTIEATVENYNPHDEMAELRMANGKVYKVPLKRFIEADQAYLLEWREDYEKSFVRISFFTHRIDSARIVFMLDGSSNMHDGRWKKLVRNMTEVIENMDDEADFNIIVYGSSVAIFEKDLVSANEENKRLAIKWLNSKSVAGRSNLYAAVRAAGKMKKAEVYAVLSHGYPSGKPQKIFDQITQNETTNEQQIRVFSVSYEAAEPGKNFMMTLAKRFNGGYVIR